MRYIDSSIVMNLFDEIMLIFLDHKDELSSRLKIEKINFQWLDKKTNSPFES